GPALQREGGARQVPDQREKGVRGRRHAPRPESRRLGDQRGPRRGTRMRPLPHGRDGTAVGPTTAQSIGLVLRWAPLAATLPRPTVLVASETAARPTEPSQFDCPLKL